MAFQFNQIATAASAAASPTSITPSLPNPSGAGNSLILAVVATGTPTITPPTGWTVIQNNVAPAGLAVALFILPGALNTGIQSVAVTLTATLGGAVAALFETNATTLSLDTSGTQNGTGTSYGNIGLSGTAQFQQLLFYVCGFAAATLTPSNTTVWSGAVGTAVSTNGTPNAQIACFFQVTANIRSSTIGGSFSASVVNQEDIARFFIPGSDAATNNPTGVYVGAGGNPAGSLQVPQQQGIGNFYSGSTGG